ncbi:hypothetical protein P3S67_026443 [Capsicum chacoense]
MNELLKNPIVATHAVIAAGFSTLATAIGYPFDSMKALVQVGSSSGKQLTCADVVNKYNGMGWLTLGRSLGLGARFGVYEILTAFYREFDEDVGPLSPLTVSLAAGFSGSLAAAASHGFATAKSRSQCMVLPKVSDEDVGPLSPLAVSLAAGFSGSLAAAASHGFDTAKSRSQCMVLPKYCMYPWRGFLKWKLPGKRFESWTGIHPTDRNILFRGLGLRMARSGIASFVVVGGYLFAIDKVLSE